LPELQYLMFTGNQIGRARNFFKHSCHPVFRFFIILTFQQAARFQPSLFRGCMN
jgi:hypothetical protein